jgi:hypothetical protein
MLLSWSQEPTVFFCRDIFMITPLLVSNPRRVASKRQEKKHAEIIHPATGTFASLVREHCRPRIGYLPNLGPIQARPQRSLDESAKFPARPSWGLCHPAVPRILYVGDSQLSSALRTRYAQALPASTIHTLSSVQLSTLGPIVPPQVPAD